MIKTEIYFTYDCLLKQHIVDATTYIKNASLNDSELRIFIEENNTRLNRSIDDFNSEESLHNFLLNYTSEVSLYLPYKASINDFFYFYNFKEYFEKNNPITKYFLDLFNFGYIHIDLIISKVEIYPDKICIHLIPE